MTLEDRLAKLEAQVRDLQGQLAALRRHVRMTQPQPAQVPAQTLDIQWLDQTSEASP